METLESLNRNHLHFIEEVVYVEFAILSALILVGGLLFGLVSGKWGLAVFYLVVLLSTIAVSMVLIYATFRQFNKIEKFQNRLASYKTLWRGLTTKPRKPEEINIIC